MIIIIFLAVILGCSPAMAEIAASTDDPMVIGGGARPLGMGRAFVAVADDADGPLINPGGTAASKSPQLMSMFTNLLGDVYYTEFTGNVPSAAGVIGAGYVNTGVSNVLTFIGTTGVYSDYHDRLFILNYSSPLARFFGYGRNVYVGLNLKYFSRGWTGGVYQIATGFSADYGAKFILNPYLSFGFSHQNFLPVDLGGVLRYPSGAEEAISSIFKIGTAIRPIPFGRKLLIVYDIDLPAQSARPLTMHLGTEYEVSDNFMVRGGLDQSIDPTSAARTSWNPSIGISLGTAGFRMDYAYHAYYNDPSLATNYVSFSYRGAPSLALEGEIR